MRFIIKLQTVFILLCLAQGTAGQDMAPDTLRVGYTSSPPFVIEHNRQLTGASIWLWEESAKAMNLTYELVPMPFGDMLDSLTTGGIDVSINPLTIRSDRAESMLFTAPFFAAHAVIAEPRSSPLRRLLEFIGSFFSLSFLSGFLVLLFLVFVFGFLAWWFEHKVNPIHFRPGLAGVWDGLWWSVVTMTTVGYGDKAPQTPGGKMVALIWMFSGLLFISGITASIASSLTVNELSINREQLDDYKSRPVATVAQSSTATYLRDHFFRELRTYPNLTASLDSVLADKAEAIIYDEPILRYRLAQEERFAKFKVLPIKFNVEFYAFALPFQQRELALALSQQMLQITEGQEWQVVLTEFGLGDE